MAVAWTHDLGGFMTDDGSGGRNTAANRAKRDPVRLPACHRRRERSCAQRAMPSRASRVLIEERRGAEPLPTGEGGGRRRAPLGSRSASAGGAPRGSGWSSTPLVCARARGYAHAQELLLRWLQFGAVSPLFRTHCSHCEMRPWKYPNFELLVKHAGSRGGEASPPARAAIQTNTVSCTVSPGVEIRLGVRPLGTREVWSAS